MPVLYPVPRRVCAVVIGAGTLSTRKRSAWQHVVSPASDHFVWSRFVQRCCLPPETQGSVRCRRVPAEMIGPRQFVQLYSIADTECLAHLSHIDSASVHAVDVNLRNFRYAARIGETLERRGRGCILHRNVELIVISICVLCIGLSLAS